MDYLRIEDIKRNCFSIQSPHGTLATITSRGVVDWLIHRADTPGPTVTCLHKETHLALTSGLKFDLMPPSPACTLTALTWSKSEQGVTACAKGVSNDHTCTVKTCAYLKFVRATGEYRWYLNIQIRNVSREPVTHPWVEFTNVYPTGCGSGFTLAPQKRFTHCIIGDVQGRVWKLPHQHSIHLAGVLETLDIGVGSFAGYVDEPNGNPIVVIQTSNVQPDWQICDMFYDLHCGGIPKEPLLPGKKWVYGAHIHFLGNCETQQCMKNAHTRAIPPKIKPLPAPRVDLGRNLFTKPAMVDAPDTCAVFRQRPPQCTWVLERDTELGYLQIHNKEPQETVWPAEPPTNAPAGRCVRVSGRILTDNVFGEGAFIRLRHHVFTWNPEPHMEWLACMQSTSVKGTTTTWVEVTVPEWRVPDSYQDCMLWIEFVLKGTGTAKLGELTVAFSTPTPDSVP